VWNWLEQRGFLTLKASVFLWLPGPLASSMPSGYLSLYAVTASCLCNILCCCLGTY
jgi:hypothetical protein